MKLEDIETVSKLSKSLAHYNTVYKALLESERQSIHIKLWNLSRPANCETTVTHTCDFFEGGYYGTT